MEITLTSLHWMLAFSGAAIYVLLKIQEMNGVRGYQFGAYLKKHWASTVATIIMIPVLMLIMRDNFSDILPINNVTAVLVGYQTNSLFRTVMGASAKKFISKNEDTPEENEESNP